MEPLHIFLYGCISCYVRRLLERVISCCFWIEWPPQSPNLTQCDFWPWFYLKSKVYQGVSWLRWKIIQYGLYGQFLPKCYLMLLIILWTECSVWSRKTVDILNVLNKKEFLIRYWFCIILNTYSYFTAPHIPLAANFETIFIGILCPLICLILQNLAPFSQLGRELEHLQHCQFNYCHPVYK